MKRLFIFVLIVGLSSLIGVYADEPTDTIADQHLDEVTVEASMQRVAAKMVEYTPTKRLKNISSSGQMLLQHMAIPELDVSPVSGEVKTMIGDDVVIFIDYVKATDNDLAGMQTQDVLKVEYYDYPTDPRFMGAQHVVNFIMQQYDYGGYTKLSALERMIGYNYGGYSAFSKMKYRMMTYDVYAGYRFNSSRPGCVGAETDEIYRLPDAHGQLVDINRHTEYWTRNKDDRFAASFRARYATDKVQITNTVTFTREHQPDILTSGMVSYSTRLIAGGESSSHNASQSLAPSYNGTFYFTLPNDFALSFSPQLSYTHNKEWNHTTEGDYYDVLNNVRENAFYSRGNLRLNKRFAQVHTVLVGVDGSYGSNKVSYVGSYPSIQKFHHEFVAALVGYSSQSGKIYTNVDAGVSNEWSTINGYTKTHFYPFVHVQEQYVPNNQNQLSLWFQYASNSPQVSEKSENLIRSNELLWVRGNPELHNSDHVTVSLNYTWLPNNKYRFGVYGGYYGRYNTRVFSYEPFEDGLVRQPFNSGDLNVCSIAANASCYLFERTLVFQAGPSFEYYNRTGMLRDNFSTFNLWANASWYHGNFWVSGYLNTPTRIYDADDGSVMRQKMMYQISAGWGNSAWTVQAQWQMFANYSWRNYTSSLYTPYYDRRQVGYNTGMHSNVGVTVTYTVGYGKKVTRGDEISAGEGIGSAILK